VAPKDVVRGADREIRTNGGVGQVFHASSESCRGLFSTVDHDSENQDCAEMLLANVERSRKRSI
jgi:hypothetical protein